MRIRTGPDYSVYLPYFLVAFLIIGVDLLGWLSGIRALGERVINPITYGVRNVAATSIRPFETFRFMLKGSTRVADLESRYAEALVKTERVEELERENESLRKLLGSGSLKQYNYIPVKTISIGGELVLSAGSNLGILAGESLVDENHVLVGRVSRVSSWTSWATRITSSLISIPVVIGNAQVSGLMDGIGDKGEIKVEQADKVYEGDEVVTSGINGDFVSGLLLGRVVEVEEETANVYKKVVVEPLGNPGKIVYLVRSKEVE